jgi:flagellar basal body-associated protein FliL
MAEEKDAEKQNGTEQEKTEEKPGKRAYSRRFLPWIMMSAVVALCAGAGFGVGRIAGGFRKPETAPQSQEQDAAQEEDLRRDTSGRDSDDIWYYDIQPVVANLDEPGVKRYVRATLTLAISSNMDQKKGVAFLDEKRPLLTNWLTIYLASLGIEDIRGDKNLRRVQSQILDTFNQKLFPDAKPQIQGILFREFAVQ